MAERTFKMTISTWIALIAIILTVGGSLIVFTSRVAVIADDLEEVQTQREKDMKGFEKGIDKLTNCLRGQGQYTQQLILWQIQVGQAKERGDAMPTPPIPPSEC